MCDDHSGYKAGFATGRVLDAGCLAHARRKFFDLHASNKSQVAESALQQIARMYEIEREVKDLAADERQRIRQLRSQPLLDALHQWMLLTRQKITDGSATARALDYTLKRWAALACFARKGDCLWTTTGLKTRSGRLPLAETTGYLRARSGLESAQLR